MHDDPEFNIQFCEEVEKYRCLYDNTRSDYSNRAAQDQAWAKIGEHLNEKATDCKDRWKNIRGRYVKCKNQKKLSSGSRTKDYYLTPHLIFLDAFLKSRQSKCNMIKETVLNKQEHSVDEEEDVSEENESEIYNSPAASPLPQQHSVNLPPPCSSDDAYRKKKKSTTSLSDVHEQAFKYFEKKQKILEGTNPRGTTDPDMAFLQSLLPDMKCMDKSTKRKFKMGILKLADQLLDPLNSDCPSSQSGSEYDPHRPFSSVTNNIGTDSDKYIDMSEKKCEFMTFETL